MGLKSLLFGAHQFILHPLFVLMAWIRLFGMVWDIRFLLAVLMHDWGYAAAAKMDRQATVHHVSLGGKIIGRLFGDVWGNFARLHSKRFAQSCELPVSPLCIADKCSMLYYPRVLYFVQTILTGELNSYMMASGFGDQRKLRGLRGWKLRWDNYIHWSNTLRLNAVILCREVMHSLDELYAPASLKEALANNRMKRDIKANKLR